MIQIYHLVEDILKSIKNRREVREVAEETIHLIIAMIKLQSLHHLNM